MSDERGGRREGRGATRAAREARIDSAIDGAVREMLDVEPQAGFRSRVQRRIESGDSRAAVASGFRRKILLFGMPLAAAAIVILAVLLPRMTEGPQQQPQPQQQATTVRTQAPVTPPVAVTQPTTPVAKPPVIEEPRVVARVVARVGAPRNVAPRDVAPVPAERTIAAADLASPDSARTIIEPLGAITPIEMTPIAERRYAPADIAVRPLTPITELQIAPLTPPSGRD